MKKRKNKKLPLDLLGDIASTFRMLGDETRSQLVYLLCQKELSVGELCAEVDVSPSAVSHQLAKLRANRLVKTRRDGNSILYSIDDSHVARLFREAIYHLEHVKQNLPDNSYPGTIGRF